MSQVKSLPARAVRNVAVAAGVIHVVRRIAQSARAQRDGHISHSEAAYAAAETRVLIMGGGFGGLETALTLDKELHQAGQAGKVSVLVVDRNNDLLFTPLLWTVADGRAGPNGVVVPLRSFQRGRRFHILHAEVTGIDLGQRIVSTSFGDQPYDYLVLAVGSVTSVPDLPGLRTYGRRFHSPADAVDLRNTIIDAVEAAHQTTDPEERRAWLTFVVGGGGDTGIELAATIHDYLSVGLLARYPWLAVAPVRIVVVGRADRLIPMSDPRTSDAVRRVLQREGIEILTGVAIRGASAKVVQTTAGDIPARTLFWAAGITAPPLVQALSVEKARNGAVLVNDHLRIDTHPEVFVVGDAAWAIDPETGSGVPPTAQAAQHEGRYVGKTIAAELRGAPVRPFRFATRGHLALLGNRTGVAEVKGFTFTGFPAWLLWHLYYLYAIPSWRNRLQLGSDWLLSWLTGRETGQLRLVERTTPADGDR